MAAPMSSKLIPSSFGGISQPLLKGLTNDSAIPKVGQNIPVVKKEFLPKPKPQAQQQQAQDFDENDVQQFRDLLDKGIEPDRAKKLILQVKAEKQQTAQPQMTELQKFQEANKDKGFLQQLGESAQQFAAAPVGAIQGLSDVGKNLVLKPIAKGSAWLADKALGTNLSAGVDQATENDITKPVLGKEADSGLTQFGKGVGNALGTAALTPGVGVGGALLKGGKLLPTLGKGITAGMAGSEISSLGAGEGLASTESLAIGGALGILPGVGKLLGKAKEAIPKFLGSTADKLQLQGLLNPAKLTLVKRQLGQVGDEVGNPAKWMFDRGIKGNKEEIITQLNNLAQKSRASVDDALASVQNTYKDIAPVKDALLTVKDSLKGVRGLEGEMQAVDDLLAKNAQGRLTLSDMNQTKRIIDEIQQPFTQVGDIKAAKVQQGVANLRQQIRKKIEDEAEKYGLPDIKALNKETQIGKTLSDAISKKDSADKVRELLTSFAPSGVGGIIGGASGPSPLEDPVGFLKNVAIGVASGKILGSTRVKTNVASFLNKLSMREKQQIVQYVKSEGKIALPESITQKLLDESSEKGNGLLKKLSNK